MKCAPLTLRLHNSTKVELVAGIERCLAHPRLMGKMMWRLHNGGQTLNPKKAVLYEILFCNGKSNCEEIVDPSNHHHKCWFTLKWVISEDDLTKAHIFIKGGHGTRFRVTPSALHISPAVCCAIIKSDGLNYSQGGATMASQSVLQQQERAEHRGSTTKT